MFHHVARSEEGPLFVTYIEGAALWWRLVDAFPEAIAIAVMPDHVHLVLPHDDPGGKLGAVLSGYARWRHRHRGGSGPVWRPLGAPRVINDPKHLRRTIRYLHLNPCRSGLTRDPFTWPWTTHRDSVGFASPPVVPQQADPARFHDYVSKDDTCSPMGTPLPTVRFETFDWFAIRDAVSAITRTHVDELTLRGAPRTLALKTAWIHQVRDVDLLCDALGVSKTTVYRVVADLPQRGAHLADPALAACVRAVGDPRFGSLMGYVPMLGWRPYRRAVPID